MRACDLAGNSSTTSFSYTIDTVAPSSVVATPIAGTYNTIQSVSLSAEGSDQIRYSTTSTPVDCSSGTLYTSSISVSSSETIYARACDLDGNSSTASFVYCLSGTLYSSSTSFPSLSKLYMRVCNSLNSSISTFEFTTPVGSVANVSSGGGGGMIRYYTSINNTSSNNVLPVVNNPKIITEVPIIVGVSAIQKVEKDLEIGMQNKDVKTLQLFLIKQNKGPYAKKLSLNSVTNYFGKLTQNALIEWQKANKIFPANGNFGLKTRTKIKLLNL